MNGADSEPRRQLPTTAAREMTASQPKWRQLCCVEYDGLLEIVFFAIKVTFAGYQFMTDFYSQNRCVCSTRSHGPLLCAFCLSFHFHICQTLDIYTTTLDDCHILDFYKTLDFDKTFDNAFDYCHTLNFRPTLNYNFKPAGMPSTHGLTQTI